MAHRFLLIRVHILSIGGINSLPLRLISALLYLIFLFVWCLAVV